MKLPFLILLLAGLTLIASGQSPTVNDEFDDDRYGWWTGESNGGSQRIENGKLQLNSPAGGWASSINVYVDVNEDFRLAANITQTGGVSNKGFGLMWGYNKALNSYNYLVIASTGYYFIGSTNKATNNLKPKKGWVQSSVVNPLGKANQIAVEQTAGVLHFIINGTEVDQYPAFPWDGTAIGIINYDQMNLEIDHYRFSQPGVVINLPPKLTTGLVKVNLGPGVNTPVNDVMPRISADGKLLYFTRQYYAGNLGGIEDAEDYYSSTWDGSKWSDAINLGEPFNTKTTDNISSISTDNNTIIFVDATQFWKRTRSLLGWNAPELLGITYRNEAKHFESYLSSDGKAMLFTTKNSSNLYYDTAREERDIYVSLQNDDGQWEDPINLGPTVNTRFDEVSPFLAADGKTLYFSSHGHPGYGSADIFMTRRTGPGWTEWTKPVNLGPEINSYSFDAYYVLPASGEIALMVTDKDGYGKTDIVSIRLPKEIKPDPVVLVRGRTLDAKNQKPISADIIIENLSTNKNVGEAISDPATGEYKITLPYGANYGFHAAAPGHLSVSENLDLTEVKSFVELSKDLYLSPIEVGERIKLNNVFFEQAKAILKQESYAELDRLVDIMKENPSMEIELGGYTDNQGNSVRLILLSQDRISTVKKYMTDKGIAPRRIAGKGYGPANPIAPNDTEEHRRLNRRVEFKITKK
ncbi:MAG: OmpA family protein [Cyclobacteriaceae bacterium]|jgi:outer membrane protein OmpA-like peptidoglycan-associated protein|nr:OmpA family protein [Cyclobacteriaceae bacterium]